MYSNVTGRLNVLPQLQFIVVKKKLHLIRNTKLKNPNATTFENQVQIRAYSESSLLVSEHSVHLLFICDWEGKTAVSKT